MNPIPLQTALPRVGRVLRFAAVLLLAALTPVALRAEEPHPTPPKGPPSSSEAQRLLDEEASNQRKIKEEVAAEVESHYQAGKRLNDNLDYEGARKELELALRLDASNEKVRSLLLTVTDKFGAREARIHSAMQSVADYKKAETAGKLVELDNRLDRGRRYLSEAKSDTLLTPAERIVRMENALVEFERARELIKYMPYEVDTSEQSNEVARLSSDSERSIKSLRAEIDSTSRSAAEIATRQVLDLQKRNDERKLNTALDYARVSFETGRYQLAVKQAQKVLELDPLNADAAAIIVKAQDRAYESRDKYIREEYRHNFKLQRERADAMSVPYSSYLEYPPNWREITLRQAQDYHRRADEPWKDEIRKKMRRLVSFEFVDTPLEDALKFLDAQTKVTIILDSKVAAESAKSPVNLRVQDMELEQALRWILKLVDLEYDLRNQAVFITKKADLNQNLELEIYDIRDLTTQVADFPGPNIAIGTAGGADANANPFGAPAAVGGLQDTDLASLIKERILAPEFADAATSIEVSSGKLVVMQRPEVHDRIRQLLRSFRETQTIQVLTQVRFIDSTDDFLEQIGINLTGLDAAPGDVGVAHALVDPLAQPTRFGLFANGGGPGPTAPLPSDIQPSPAFQFQHFIPNPPFVLKNPGAAPPQLLHPRLDANFPNGGNTTFGPALAPVGFRNQTFGNGSPILTQGLTQNFLRPDPLGTPLGNSLQSNPAQGALFQFRFLQGLQMNAILQAIRKDQTSDELLAPKLMQFNNQRSHVMVAQQRSYIKDYDVSGAVYDPVISSFLTGVVLEVRPTVSNDKRYITLELRPGTATELTPPIIVFITSGGNIAIPGGLINLPIELPNLELRSVNTTVTIPDNGTMLFSGLINDRKIDAKSGVPFLSDLPVIGRFFSVNNKERVRRNLLILVNSRIVLFDEEEANLSERSAPLPRYPKLPIVKCKTKCNTCDN